MTKWERLWEHEDHRWSYMSDGQLLTRLGRIRNPIKLECFIMMAQRYRKGELERVALNRQASMSAVAEQVKYNYNQYQRRDLKKGYIQRAGDVLRARKVVSPPRKTDFLAKVADMERAIDF